MFAAQSPNARRAAAAIALIAFASLAARVWLSTVALDGDVLAALWDLGRFFTILTNTLVMVTFGLVAIRRDGVSAQWLAALTVAILLVGGVYHALLADLVDFTGLAAWADQGVHTAVPLACGFWWLAFAPKRALSFADLPMFILWPSVYLAYALARGARDGIYPYPFVDLNTLSAAAVGTNIAGLMVVILLVGLVFIGIGRFDDR